MFFGSVVIYQGSTIVEGTKPWMSSHIPKPPNCQRLIIINANVVLAVMSLKHFRTRQGNHGCQKKPAAWENHHPLHG